jgi:solute carrier family 25 aspartate/glutamate transporter 12/13
MTPQLKSEKNDSVKKLQVEPVSSLSSLKISDHLLVERADEGQLKTIFDKYASLTHHNQPAMKSEDLIQKYLGLLSTTDFNEKTLRILANLVDINKDGYITFDEFKRFEELLCSPDVLFKSALQLFEIKVIGLVTYDNFK